MVTPATDRVKPYGSEMIDVSVAYKGVSNFVYALQYCTQCTQTTTPQIKAMKMKYLEIPFSDSMKLM